MDPKLGVAGLRSCFPIVLLIAATGHAAPDLTITAVDGSRLVWDEVNGRGIGTVLATLRNAGDVSTGSTTVTVFFEDRNRNGALDPADVMVGRATEGPLAAGATATLSINVDVPLEFRQRPISVFSDSGNLVVESDELNNVGRSGLECAFTRAAGPMDAQLEWSWLGTQGDSSFVNVPMTPAVADLDGDGVPEVLVATTQSTAGGPLVIPGVLRSFHGDDGSLAFTVWDATLRINSTSSLAVGDLDLDGRAEILACDSTGVRLICFEHDGTFKWRSPALETINWGAPSIADLDADGVPEIVIGRQALNANGSIRWSGTGGTGGIGQGPFSVVADVDQNGSPDVVAGNTIYNASGAIQATGVGLSDGFVAVANFDADPFAEIVLVYPTQIRLLEHTLAVKWGPVTLPAGFGGGLPSIADFDGDGMPEIAVQGNNKITVFETDGSIKWSAAISDLSSGRTGCSAFDFDGDGAVEVIGRDEQSLWIFRGADGGVLQQISLGSCTWYEYALVADVDADGDGEIVAGANSNCFSGPHQGVRVYGSANDRWVATRRTWNQPTYHVTNVSDDVSIPRVETSHWLFPSAAPFNSFRQSVLGGGAPSRGVADLTASRLVVSCAVDSHRISVRVGNAGSVIARRGIPVSFYDGDPSGGGGLLATRVTTTVLEPGAHEDVATRLLGVFAPSGPLWAVVDDPGAQAGAEIECDTTNNRVARSLMCPPLADTPGSFEEPLALDSHPNPFIGVANIGFALATSDAVRLDVLDVGGRRVRRLVDANLPSGRHAAAWDGTDERGNRPRPGIYYFALRSGGRLLLRRTAMLR